MRYIVVIERDTDFEIKGYTDQPDLERETSAKLISGEWEVYGTGLGRTNDNGAIEPDYATFVWGTVTDAGHEGTYLGADKIRHDYLRSLAIEQADEYGTDAHRV